jgi:hypothetical protein
MAAACEVVGPVGMGHLLLEINPEDAFEQQPVRESAALWSARHGWITGMRFWRQPEALLERSPTPLTGVW